MRHVLLSCVLFGCASTAPGRGYVGEGGVTAPPASDGGSWSDAGVCPPKTFAGTPCKGATSCWVECFSCLGNPPTWDKHAPLQYRCINGEYGTSGSVTCWNGRYSDIACTTLVDGGK